MTFEEWIAGLPLRRTRNGEGRGVLLDLTFTVQPQGFGYLTYKDGGTGRSGTQPVNNVKEAENVVREIWARAQAFGQQPPNIE